MRTEFSLNHQNEILKEEAVYSINDQNGKENRTEIYGITNMNGVTGDQVACYHLLNENGVEAYKGMPSL